jgi:pilus assembly protein FimV
MGLLKCRHPFVSKHIFWIDAFRGVVMVVKRSSPALALLLVVPSAACALGLGDIRLRSRLDQPLDARIALLDATPDALQSLEVRIAPQDAFAQYGLSWAPYLTGVHLKTVRTASGQEVVQLSSDQPISDPVVTLLVEATWDRGRLIREYTVLLDPPLYVPSGTQASQPTVAPAVTRPGARQGQIGSAAAQPPATPAPEEANPAPAVSASPAAAPGSAPAGSGAVAHSLKVRPGQTLSGIASRLAGAPLAANRTGRWMVAIYRGNPRAFDHNMNLLRAGTILRVPSAADVGAISSASAWGEIRAQYAAWRGGAQAAGTAAAGPGRLRLVAPSSGTGATAGAASSGAPSAKVKALQQQVSTLETQLQSDQRLLQLKDAQLAKLQAQFGHPAASAPASGASSAQSAAPAPAPTPAATSVAAAPPPPAAPAPHAAPPARASRPVAVKPFQPASGGSFLGTLKEYWWAAALLVLALLGWLASRVLRSRRQAELDDSLGKLAAAGVGAAARQVPHARAESALSDTGSMRRPDAVADSFVVEESGTHERPHLVEGAPPSARHISPDQTISSETAINLEQGDPLAEADFHMAYGLYDQAADLIRIAIAREPERRDLKSKLLEVFFVWGNKEQFLQSAHELAGTRAEAAPGEWEKIVIMGKQLAPEDPLFASGTAVSGAASGGVDLDLEGGESNSVDFDILPGSATQAVDTLSAATLDLDIGSALGEPDVETTAESPGGATDRNAALFDGKFGDNATGSTREMTATLPGSQDSTAEFGTEVEGPTVEQPALELSEQPLRRKVESAMRQSGAEQTAELAIDDLGLGLGAFDGAAPTGAEEGAEDSEATENREAGEPPDLAQEDEASESPTLVAGFDEATRRIMQQVAEPASDAAPGSTGTTNSWQLDEKELEAMLAEGESEKDPGATSRIAAPEGLEGLAGLETGGVDFDLGSEGGEPAHGGNGSALDLDVGTATVPEGTFIATQKISSDELALPDLEPVTMSEVGTKLDLARAYMDMGDPEGARNILEEVMHEGSVAQRQEAERLMVSLPG